MTVVRTLNAILMLLGALSVLMLGAAPATAEAPPPCHEMTGRSGPDMPQPTPDDAMMAMGCCIACVTAPDLTPPVRGRIAAPPSPPVAPRLSLPAGLSPAPEHGPPKA